MPDAAMRDELTLRQLLAVCDRGIENLEKAAGGTERPSIATCKTYEPESPSNLTHWAKVRTSRPRTPEDLSGLAARLDSRPLFPGRNGHMDLAAFRRKR